LHAIVLGILTLGLGACSLYQSDSRKFLEKQAIEFAGSAAQANLVDCPEGQLEESWQLKEETPKAGLYTHDLSTFELRVVPMEQSPLQQFSCVYRFASDEELTEKTQAAVELTVFYLGLSPGGFAFHPISHLK